MPTSLQSQQLVIQFHRTNAEPTAKPAGGSGAAHVAIANDAILTETTASHSHINNNNNCTTCLPDMCVCLYLCVDVYYACLVGLGRRIARQMRVKLTACLEASHSHSSSGRQWGRPRARQPHTLCSLSAAVSAAAAAAKVPNTATPTCAPMWRLCVCECASFAAGVVHRQHLGARLQVSLFPVATSSLLLI